MVSDDGTCEAVAQRSELRGDVPCHQAIALGGDLAYLAIVAHHYRASAINVTKSEVGTIERIGSGDYAAHLTLLIEADSSEPIERHHPHIALHVAIHSGASLLESLVEKSLHLMVLARRNDGLQGGEVEHLRTFLKRYPQTLEVILIHVAATVASQADMLRAQPEVDKVITIVAHQSSAVRTDPHESEGVLEDVVGEVVGHARSHVEIAYVIHTGHSTLSHTAQGYHP